MRKHLSLWHLLILEAGVVIVYQCTIALQIGWIVTGVILVGSLLNGFFYWWEGRYALRSKKMRGRLVDWWDIATTLSLSLIFFLVMADALTVLFGPPQLLHFDGTEKLIILDCIFGGVSLGLHVGLTYLRLGGWGSLEKRS